MCRTPSAKKNMLLVLLLFFETTSRLMLHFVMNSFLAFVFARCSFDVGDCDASDISVDVKWNKNEYSLFMIDHCFRCRPGCNYSEWSAHSTRYY